MTCLNLPMKHISLQEIVVATTTNATYFTNIFIPTSPCSFPLAIKKKPCNFLRQPLARFCSKTKIKSLRVWNVEYVAMYLWILANATVGTFSIFLLIFPLYPILKKISVYVLVFFFSHIFCRACLETKQTCPTCNVVLTPSTISASPFVKHVIDGSEVYCFTRLEELEGSASNDGLGPVAVFSLTNDKRKTTNVSIPGAAAAKKMKIDHCTWTGKLMDAKQHFDECMYAGATCRFDGCDFVVVRKDMAEHEAICPQRTQPCKWCQMEMLVDGRRGFVDHQTICHKREVKCKHAHRGCKALMSFEKRDQHVANDCLYETIACPFSTVGCTERMMRKEIEHHEETMMKQHNRMLLQDSLALRDNPLYELVYKMNVNDLVGAGVVVKPSPDTFVGGYKVCCIHVTIVIVTFFDCTLLLSLTVIDYQQPFLLYLSTIALTTHSPFFILPDIHEYRKRQIG